MLNTHNIYSNGTMETYDDRPISMYDNLNNMTTNTNTPTATTMSTMNSSTTKLTKAPTMTNSKVTVTPTMTNSKVTVTPTTSSKTNGAIHSTPFPDITFKFNDNNNITQQKQKQNDNDNKKQQLELNGNRNLNEITPNTGNTAAVTAAVYATPYKTLASSIKPVVIATTASSSATPIIVQQQHIPKLANATTTTTAQILTSLPSTTTTTTTAAATAIPTAALNSDTLNSFNRPLSQHSQSELNDTSNSIAAVKAALNEAKSKFFGLNGNATTSSPTKHHYQQDQQHNYDDIIYEISAKHQLLPIEQQQQVQNLKKPQPKYQNIPENSAIYRNQTTPTSGGDCGGGLPPELPPKPVEYQNLQQPLNRNLKTATTPDHQRKMTGGGNTSYNQISLNDIDGSASRSQTVYMATTVPQNIKGNKIAGRHTPTRSSLRHSRMLVINNKNYEEVQHPNPMGFQQPNLARWLLILQIIIGVLILSLSIWTFFLTPNAPIQDNPYWCGLVLLITGVIGLILIRYQRIKRAKTREHCFIFLRMDSYILSLLSVLLCCVALIFAAIHYCRLTAADTKCQSMYLLVEHGSCVCTFNAPPMANTTEPLLGESNEVNDINSTTDNSYNVEYRDLSCQEVTGPWTSILLLSFIFNCLGFIISLMYIILLACCRKTSNRLYTTVRTSTF